MSQPNSTIVQALRPLTSTLPFLAVTTIASFATVTLFRALGDEPIVVALGLVTRVISALLMTNVVLLVGCLGMRAVAADETLVD